MTPSPTANLAILLPSSILLCAWSFWCSFSVNHANFYHLLLGQGRDAKVDQVSVTYLEEMPIRWRDEHQCMVMSDPAYLRVNILVSLNKLFSQVVNGPTWVKVSLGLVFYFALCLRLHLIVFIRHSKQLFFSITLTWEYIYVVLEYIFKAMTVSTN